MFYVPHSLDSGYSRSAMWRQAWRSGVSSLDRLRKARTIWQGTEEFVKCSRKLLSLFNCCIILGVCACVCVTERASKIDKARAQQFNVHKNCCVPKTCVGSDVQFLSSSSGSQGKCPAAERATFLSCTTLHCGKSQVQRLCAVMAEAQ